MSNEQSEVQVGEHLNSLAKASSAYLRSAMHQPVDWQEGGEGDGEEGPDVDTRYQAAVSAISGQGGWPLTAFLTPDGKPFFGGTYFPPEDAMGRPGFKRILLGIADAFKTRRAEVDSSAKALEEAVAKAEVFHTARGEFDAGVVDSVIESALHLFDEAHGGFGGAP